MGLLNKGFTYYINVKRTLTILEELGMEGDIIFKNSPNNTQLK